MSALIILFIADMATDAVDVPWWLYLLVFLFGAGETTAHRS